MTQLCMKQLVEKLSAAAGDLETQLADGALYEEARKSELTDLLQQQARLSSELADAESRWLEVLEQLEQA